MNDDDLQEALGCVLYALAILIVVIACSYR
jgi:hypothetical protein